MVEAVLRKRGYHCIGMDELVNDYRQYWFSILSLFDNDVIKAEKYYKKWDVVKLVQMRTDKLAATFQEPDISIQDEYKKG